MAEYLVILIWPAIIAGVTNAYGKKKAIKVFNKIEYRHYFLALIIAVIPLIYYTTNRSLGFGDTSSYIFMFNLMPTDSAQIADYMTTVSKDEFFYLTSALFKSFISDKYTTYFAFFAIFHIMCILFVYRKYSESAFLSLFLFLVSTDYISWMYNGIRQFTAVCLTFICFGLILKKKFIPAIIIITFASFFHGSALIVIPFIFIAQGKAWNKNTLLFIFGIIIALTFLEEFTSILDTVLADTQYTNVVSDWQGSNDDGTNIIRVFIYSIPAILSLYGRKKIKKINNPIINLCTNMSIASSGFYIISMFTSGIYIGRLPIYFSLYSYILLPWEIKNLFTKDVAKTIYAIMIIAYIGYYFYSLRFGFGLI